MLINYGFNFCSDLALHDYQWNTELDLRLYILMFDDDFAVDAVTPYDDMVTIPARRH